MRVSLLRLQLRVLLHLVRLLRDLLLPLLLAPQLLRLCVLLVLQAAGAWAARRKTGKTQCAWALWLVRLLLLVLQSDSRTGA